MDINDSIFKYGRYYGFLLEDGQYFSNTYKNWKMKAKSRDANLVIRIKWKGKSNGVFLSKAVWSESRSVSYSGWTPLVQLVRDRSVAMNWHPSSFPKWREIFIRNRINRWTQTQSLGQQLSPLSSRPEPRAARLCLPFPPFSLENLHLSFSLLIISIHQTICTDSDHDLT